MINSPSSRSAPQSADEGSLGVLAAVPELTMRAVTTLPAVIDRRAFLQAAARIGALGTAALYGVPRALAEANPALRSPAYDAAVQGRTFNMLVLGDSIMWGQGLDDESKFSRKIEHWLEQRLGRTVRRDVFAHSGARIARDAQGDAHPPLPGEVPDWYPSIPHQIELANTWLAGHPITDAEHAEPFRPDNIHLVLIDGGINDVHVDDILTVDPTIADPVAWVRKLTHEWCAPQMQPLLETVLKTYPNARVVVSGYYPIVSDLTDIAELGKLLDMFGLLGGLLDRAVDSALRQRLASQSRAFHETYVSEIRSVVERVSSHGPVLGGLARVGKSSRVVAPMPRLRGARCIFVDVAFQPEHSFGAPNTMLYGVNAHDPAAASRATECQHAGQGSNPKCYWASAGHPNPAGATRYTDAIERALESFLPDWSGAGSTPVAPAGTRSVPRR
jgi:GDSL-like Lipase/Acylhydrolase family